MQNQKARFSRVGCHFPAQNDFRVAFSDLQRLRHLQDELLKAVLILNTTLEIAGQISSMGDAVDTRKLGQWGNIDRGNTLEAYRSQLRIHKNIAERLLKIAKGTSQLVTHLHQSRLSSSQVMAGYRSTCEAAAG